jgi:hypothetical protein
MKIRSLGLILVVAVLASACGDSSSPAAPNPGSFTLVYSAPNNSTGALVLRVSGGPVDSIVPVGAGVYGSATADASGGSALIAGTLTSGATVGTVYVPDVTSAPAYRVVVNEAANRATNDQEAPVNGIVRIVQP